MLSINLSSYSVFGPGEAVLDVVALVGRLGLLVHSSPGVDISGSLLSILGQVVQGSVFLFFFLFPSQLGLFSLNLDRHLSPCISVQEHWHLAVSLSARGPLSAVAAGYRADPPWSSQCPTNIQLRGSCAGQNPEGLSSTFLVFHLLNHSLLFSLSLPSNFKPKPDPAVPRSTFHLQNNNTTQQTTPANQIANMAGENGSTEHAATNPENGAAMATDLKGKGKAPSTEEPIDDTSMVDDDDDDDEEEADEVSTRARVVASRSIAYHGSG